MEITPAQPFVTGGSFVKFESQSILDPLMANCVVANDGRTSVAIVSCDLCTLPRDLVLSIRAQASRSIGIPPENIHLTATHNHSGPRIRTDLPLSEDSESEKKQVDTTRRKLVADITACLVEAHGRLAPDLTSPARFARLERTLIRPYGLLVASLIRADFTERISYMSG